MGIDWKRVNWKLSAAALLLIAASIYTLVADPYAWWMSVIDLILIIGTVTLLVRDVRK